MRTPILLMLIASVIFAITALGLLAVYFIGGAKKLILLRLAGASGMLASLFWLIRTFTEK